MAEKTDRDLLVELSTDVKWIKMLMTGHIAHHKKLFFTGLGIVGSLVIALVLLVIAQ